MKEASVWDEQHSDTRFRLGPELRLTLGAPSSARDQTTGKGSRRLAEASNDRVSWRASTSPSDSRCHPPLSLVAGLVLLLLSQMYARAVLLRRMSRPSATAAQRTAAIGRHFMSTSTSTQKSRVTPPDESPVLFESSGSVQTYVLNRTLKLNALNEPMLNILRPQVEVSFYLHLLVTNPRPRTFQEWCQGSLAKVIVGRGVGRAFCAGGDVESECLLSTFPAY